MIPTLRCGEELRRMGFGFVASTGTLRRCRRAVAAAMRAAARQFACDITISCAGDPL